MRGASSAARFLAQNLMLILFAAVTVAVAVTGDGSRGQLQPHLINRSFLKGSHSRPTSKERIHLHHHGDELMVSDVAGPVDEVGKDGEEGSSTKQQLGRIEMSMIDGKNSIYNPNSTVDDNEQQHGGTDTTRALQGGGTPADDKAALEALYAATNGPSWANNLNWLVDANVCNWAGVSCNSATPNRVRNVYLGNNNLVGTIPSDLAKLSYLDDLDLSSNALVGTIPSSIFTLPSLRYLYLDCNSLTGTIPNEVLANSANAGSSLYYVYLDHNRFTGDILSGSPLCDLRFDNLYTLVVDCEAHGAYIEVNCDCCTYCEESRDPAMLASQKSVLEEFFQSTNGTLWNVKTNWLVAGTNECDWYGVDCDYEGYVVDIDLAYNSMSGTIPSSFGQLKYLYYLFMDGNALSGSIPSEIGHMHRLGQLELHNNQLTGSLPSEIGLLTNLYDLELDFNALTGTLPSEMMGMARLEDVHLHHNQFSGAISDEIFNTVSLPSLDRLYLHNNHFTGSIEAGGKICNHRLNNWYLTTDCKGATPEVQCDCCTTCYESRKLSNLSTQKSALEALFDATNGPLWTTKTNWLVDPDVCTWYGVSCDDEGYVDYIYMRNINLDGTVPSEIGQLVYLYDLQISNQPLLAGTIPSEIGMLTSLEELLLHNNNLSGIIPTEVGQLTSMDYLSFTQNNLSGAIPNELSNLSSLRYVYLHYNSLTGTVPVEAIGSLTSLRTLYLHRNDLSGDILFDEAICLLWHDVLFGGELNNLRTDCLGAVPEIECDCCTTCYESRDVGQHTIDQEALEALYQGTNGESWRTKTNWLVDPNVCTWFGIGCDNEGYVTSINLDSNTLQGTIPTELALLSYLNNLSMDTNLLTGAIPSELGMLSSLDQCYLHSNSLIGTIPSELGQLGSVRYLDLTSNRLSGTIPNAIGNMQSLYSLHLDYNELTGSIPVSAISNLKDLDNLYLHRNDLTGAILADGPMCALRSTYSGGSLRYLYADCLGDSADDREVQCECCTNCQESRHRDELAVQKLSLEALYQSTNGVLWTNTGNWLVDLNVCTWFGVNCDVEGYVTSISMNSNNVVGTLPSEMGALRYLTSLRMMSNAMSGTLPSELGNLSSLTTLDLDRNSFTGTIPLQVLSSLSSLRTLDLSYNQFSGTLPVTIEQNMASLQYLYLQNNALTGPIPVAELGGLSSTLSHLYLERNLLTGTIEFGGPLCELRFISLSVLRTDCAAVNDNIEVQCDCCTSCITSALPPDATSAWPTMAATSSPVVPPTVSSAPSMVPPDVALQRSALEAFYAATGGQSWVSNTNWLVDPNICTWAGIGCDTTQQFVITLRLQSNRLSGSLPVELAQLSKLTDLRLDTNTITGTLPSELGALTSLHTLFLQSNSLTGALPSELGQLTSLRYLYLHQNALTGALPNELVSLKSMRTLYLSYNSFNGVVPVDMLASMSASLNTLHLQRNELTGAIASGSALCEARLIRGLSTLRVDCLGATPEIECDCCTTCYESRDPAVRNGQKAVLEGIYEATNGPSWTYNTQWLVAGTNECDWYGVSCDAEGYITTLSLNNNNLDGTLSADIGLLSYIKYLRMYNNANLSGTIPSEIGTLKSLYSWDMYSNALSGSIPSEIFGVGNTALYSINLNSNDLRGTIPSEIANLSDTLRNLYLNYNSLTGTIPVDALGSMKLLNNLYLQRNEVVGNVTYTDNLCQLRTNQLSQLRTDCNGAEPEVVCECCTACYESRDPGALMSQKSILEELYEATNGTLWRIKTNWLVAGTSECSWYGISCEAEGYVSRLYFYDNFLAGSIPSSIGQLPYLDQLYMPRNTLSGSIPSEIGMLQSLRYFDVQYNSLSGSIPSEIGKLTQLYYLELDHNALTGTLPSEMSKLASLTYIHLQFNMLTGTVPVEALGYENLPNLDRLYLYRNLLTGSISTSDALCQSRYTASGIGSLSDLYVDCAGAMPEIECDCCTSCHQSRNVAILSTQRSALEEFYAATNGPSWRYNTNWLVEGTNECDWYGVNCDSEGYVDDINLDYNSLAGSVPTSIGTLVYLNTIYLDDNLIGGTLPSEIGQLTSLETLHISSNALIGSIPSEIGELTGLESLRLDDNALTGTIPTEVGRLSLLGYVILNNNSLSGTIPLAEFGSLSSLYSLYLGSNELTTDNNSGISLNDPLCVSRLKNVLDTLVVDCGAPDGQPQLAEVPCSCCTDCYESRDPAQRTIQKSALEAFYASTNGILWAINGNWMVDPDVCTWSGVSCDDEGYVTSLSFSYNGGNSLNGILPSDIGSLPYLQMLRLGSNPLLGGTIPSEIGQLKSLGYLKLDYNALSGTMPSEIGALTSLYYLDLEFNNLRGTIPATFGSLKELSRAYLNDNSFSGPIPTSEFANLKKLGVLELHGNDFSGTITNDSPLCILRYDDLDDLTMNCGGGSAGEVSCECCTECYSDQPVSPTPPTPPSPPTPLIPPPTRSPTASPTFTPAITTSVTSPSTFESNYDNITQFIDYLADFDADFKDHLEATANALIAAYDNEYYSSYDSSSGDDYSYDYYRAGARPKKKHRVQNYKLSRSLDHNHGHRVLQNSYSLLVIAEVTSEIVGTGSDGDCNPSDPSYNCYMVETEIDVKHNPVLYPEDAVSLVVVAESSEFIADYGTYAGSVPVQLDSQVELQVTGVTDRDMSPDEIQVFEDAVLNFLQDSLISGSTSSPPIFVQNSTLVQQTISSLPSSSGGGSDGGDDNNGSDGGSSGSSSSSVLTAVVNVNGEYLPPPEIEFEDVVVEAFNDEGEEFTETLQESNDPYFSEVSAVSAKSISTDDDSSGGDEDAFGPLGMAGGVSIIIIALVGAFMGAFFVYWKKRGKANLMRKTMMHRTSMGDVPMQVEEEEVVEEEEPDVHVLVEEAPLPPKPVVTGARSLVSTTVEEFVQTSQGVERTSIKTTTNEEAS